MKRYKRYKNDSKTVRGAENSNFHADASKATRRAFEPRRQKGTVAISTQITVKGVGNWPHMHSIVSAKECHAQQSDESWALVTQSEAMGLWKGF